VWPHLMPGSPPSAFTTDDPSDCSRTTGLLGAAGHRRDPETLRELRSSATYVEPGPVPLQDGSHCPARSSASASAVTSGGRRAGRRSLAWTDEQADCTGRRRASWTRSGRTGSKTTSAIGGRTRSGLSNASCTQAQQDPSEARRADRHDPGRARRLRSWSHGDPPSPRPARPGRSAGRGSCMNSGVTKLVDVADQLGYASTARCQAPGAHPAAGSGVLRPPRLRLRRPGRLALHVDAPLRHGERSVAGVPVAAEFNPGSDACPQSRARSAGASTMPESAIGSVAAPCVPPDWASQTSDHG
jgi:hypothetical protein